MTHAPGCMCGSAQRASPDEATLILVLPRQSALCLSYSAARHFGGHSLCVSPFFSSRAVTGPPLTRDSALPYIGEWRPSITFHMRHSSLGVTIMRHQHIPPPRVDVSKSRPKTPLVKEIERAFYKMLADLELIRK
jgi:hypothetical protein